MKRKDGRASCRGREMHERTSLAHLSERQWNLASAALNQVIGTSYFRLTLRNFRRVTSLMAAKYIRRT